MDRLTLVLVLAVGAAALVVGVIWAGGAAEADGGHSATASSDEMMEDPAPLCPDAVMPEETGPNVVSYINFNDYPNYASACWGPWVWGGGAVQISRGDYSLKVTLPVGRWWLVGAPVEYFDYIDGAFDFFDYTTGGWLALNPADGTELHRYDCVSWLTWYSSDSDPVEECDPLEEGFPALLDAIVASAVVPATE